MIKFMVFLFFVLNSLSASRTKAVARQETNGLMEKLLQRNVEWANKVKIESPDLLPALHEKQTPKILWIGCSDSRVPESRIFESKPGEFFVHRNIANVIRKDDLNLNSVVEYAVAHLHVEHIIICGHYHCGGVQAAMSKLDKSYVSQWIEPINKLYLENKKELNETDVEGSWRSMVRKNIHLNAQIMAELPTVMEAKSNLTIHPWVYDTKTGLVDIIKDPSVHLDEASWVTPTKKEMPMCDKERKHSIHNQ